MTDSFLLFWTGRRRTGDPDVICSLTSLSQTPDYTVQPQKITDKKCLTYTLHPQGETPFKKEERKDLHKTVPVNLIWVCLAFTVALLQYSSVRVTDAITTDSNK